jgi:hypothetical protein
MLGYERSDPIGVEPERVIDTEDVDREREDERAEEPALLPVGGDGVDEDEDGHAGVEQCRQSCELFEGASLHGRS